MKNHIVISVLTMLLLSACATTPAPIVHQPMSMTPQSAKPMREVNGAIFQSASYRPMYEDNRARMIGDVLTINISEKTSAAKSSANSGSKTASTSMATPSLFGLGTAVTSRGSLSTSAGSKVDEKGAETASNTFTGTITATVIDVLPNGNLLVSGEKQLAFDKGAEFVRFSGVVNPTSIAAGNMVNSTQVADARFEYRSTSRLDKAEFSSMLSRFFQSLLPM